MIMKFKRLHKNINFNSTLIKAKVLNALGSTPNRIDDFMLIAENDIFGTIEAVKTLADLYIPISGSIIEINDKLESEPEFINSDPYGEGWIVKIKISDSTEIDSLLSDDDYKNLIG